MAKQTGFLKVEGTIGDITFLKTQDGYMVRQKGGVSGKRIATDPAFKRTRENGAEFGRAGKAGKLLRHAFAPQVQLVKDSRMISRLVKEMMRVLKADKVSKRGMRNVIDGEATLLQGFEFNSHSQLTTKLVAPYGCAIERTTGELSVNIPSFVPENNIVAPAGSTHFRIRSAGGAVDFATGVSDVSESATAALPLGEVATGAIQLVNTISANSTHPLFLLLGLEFLQESNGTLYPLNDGSFNSMGIVLVDA